MTCLFWSLLLYHINELCEKLKIPSVVYTKKRQGLEWHGGDIEKLDCSQVTAYELDVFIKLHIFDNQQVPFVNVFSVIAKSIEHAFSSFGRSTNIQDVFVIFDVRELCPENKHVARVRQKRENYEPYPDLKWEDFDLNKNMPCLGGSIFATPATENRPSGNVMYVTFICQQLIRYFTQSKCMAPHQRLFIVGVNFDYPASVIKSHCLPAIEKMMNDGVDEEYELIEPTTIIKIEKGSVNLTEHIIAKGETDVLMADLMSMFNHKHVIWDTTDGDSLIVGMLYLLNRHADAIFPGGDSVRILVKRGFLYSNDIEDTETKEKVRVVQDDAQYIDVGAIINMLRYECMETEREWDPLVIIPSYCCMLSLGGDYVENFKNFSLRRKANSDEFFHPEIGADKTYSNFFIHLRELTLAKAVFARKWGDGDLYYFFVNIDSIVNFYKCVAYDKNSLSKNVQYESSARDGTVNPFHAELILRGYHLAWLLQYFGNCIHGVLPVKCYHPNNSINMTGWQVVDNVIKPSCCNLVDHKWVTVRSKPIFSQMKQLYPSCSLLDFNIVV